MRVLVAAVVILAAAVRLSGHDPIGTKVTWDREILPIVEARCVSCHTAGGRAPMSLASYEEARPWARAIREEVLTRRMPQWPVVRGYGDFANDPSLSPFEIALIASWVDGGAPKTRPAGAGAASRAAPPPPAQPTRFTPPGSTREVTVRCGSGRLPAGTLVGLRPHARQGSGVRIDLTTPGGGEEPLLWTRSATESVERTFWLRSPKPLASSTPVTVEGEGCTVTFLFAARTGR
jgi:mono/diheme cytochrome c family protein